MLNKLILSIFLCLGLTSVYADEMDNKKMREAVKRVLQFVNADYPVYSISNKNIQFDKNKEFSELAAIMDTYQLNKNIWYLGKVYAGDNKAENSDMYIDAFAVEFGFNPCNGSGCSVQDLWISSPFPQDYEISIKMNYNNSLKKDFKGKYFEVKQIKKAPYPEFIITSYMNDKYDSPNFPTLKYQQKFRFNNETMKFEQIGKEKFIGKVK
ncbi:MAG: hypothetical protein J6W29_08285 [Neisseriaceae bacterium]|nr:hypothetical protein [Neisseriaceae bacterium]